MAKTTFKIRSTGFDGKTTVIKDSIGLTKAVIDDWELFFSRIGDMTNLFNNIHPLIMQANRDAFELNLASGGRKHGYWAEKYREFVGADPN